MPPHRDGRAFPHIGWWWEGLTFFHVAGPEPWWPLWPGWLEKQQAKSFHHRVGLADLDFQIVAVRVVAWGNTAHSKHVSGGSDFMVPPLPPALEQRGRLFGRLHLHPARAALPPEPGMSSAPKIPAGKAEEGLRPPPSSL